MTRDLIERELDLYDPLTGNNYTGLLQITHGFIKNNGEPGTQYIFTCKGVDVNDWRKDSNSDNLEDDLKLELASKIGKQAKKYATRGKYFTRNRTCT